MNSLLPSLLFVFVSLFGVVASSRGQVVINEIMYRPGSGYPEDTSREFIELHNPTTSPIDVGGWALTSGAGYTIPDGTIIPTGGYLVIAGAPAQVQAAYAITGVLGPWTAGATLSNNGEKVTLSRQVAGVWEQVDEVTYASEGDWATRVREPVYDGWDWSTPANGGNKSMELRNAALTNNIGQNWAPSTAAAGATPGRVNSVATVNVPPIIQGVKHSPAVPKSTDNVTISCRISDETPAANLTATLFWRLATSATPGAFQSVPMAGDGSGAFAAVLLPQANLAIVEFYIGASDGVNTRTWPAATSQGQIANCQYQVDNAPVNNADTFYRLVLTAAENTAFENVSRSSDRQFNQTLIVTRGAETTIRYRAGMRIRGASSRDYIFKPLRVSLSNDDPFDGITSFNLNPRSSYLQYLGMRAFQAAGLPAADAIPVELRRNGIEETTSSGSSPDFGKWVRMEDLNAQSVRSHWPTATGGNLYKKVRPETFWRSGEAPPSTPDGNIGGWTKQSNSGANDWSDLTTFFTKWQTNAAPHFAGEFPGDVASGSWNATGFTAAQIVDLETVADLDQWARWFAVMTILQSNETNISNGADDDYSAYFVPVGAQRRMQLFPHDLDTIFGMGDTPLPPQARGLFDMTDDGAAFSPLLPLFGNNTTPGNATFRTKYFTALRELLGGVLNANTTGNPNPPFHQFINNHLSGWVPPATVAALRTFATERQAYLLSLIGEAAITPLAATSTSTVTSMHGSLMIHEVLANNAGAVSVDGAFPDIIELRNTAAVPVDLSGMSLTDDPTAKAKFVFPAGTTVPANGYLLVYADETVGSPRTGFGLDQGGETLQLYDTAAAGQGLIDSIAFGAQPADYSIGRSQSSLDLWSLCTPTLGAENSPVATFAAPGAVRINEWLGNVNYQFDDDFVELYNPAAEPVPLGGMTVNYGAGNEAETHTLPRLSFIGGGSFLSLEAKGSAATPGNAIELPYKLSSSFGAVAFRGENGALVDRADIVGQTSDTSTGRSPNGATTLARFGLPTTLASPGSSNVAPPAGVLALMNGLRVTEILYTPTPLEFIELQNVGSTVLDLSGVRFSRGVTYTFPAGTILNPGAFIVICKDRAAFTAQFPGAVPLAPGVFSGTLDNAGETLALRPPVPWEVNILRFAYDSTWFTPTAAGHSLTVADAQATAPGDWDERSTWSASAALYGTPGSEGPPTITSLLATSTIIGDPFQYQITATKFPSSYAASPLPSGLTINTNTGLISGTPAVTGIFSVEITARNSGGTDTKQLNLTITSSGPLTSFAWANISSPQYADVPFDVSLRALDAQGRVVTSFNGSANLAAAASTGGTGATIVFTECGQGTPDYFEIQNVSGEPVNTAGWFVVLNDADVAVNSAHQIVYTLPATSAAGFVQHVTERPDDNYFGSPINWTSTQSGWAMLVDNNGTIRDFVVWGYTAAQMESISFQKNGFTLNPMAQGAWTGPSLAPQSTNVHTRSGNEDHNDASDFVAAPHTRGTQNPQLTLPFPGAAIPVPLTPSTGSFVNGVFNGRVAIAAVQPAVRLSTQEPGGRKVQSNAFDIVNSPTPVIMSPSSAVAVQGQPFSFQIVVNNPAQSFGASNLPAGLSIDTSSGLISGTPSTAGTSSIGLSAVNQSGTGTASWSLVVQADADGDGMGDAWETAHGLDPALAADAGADLDGDGQSNRDEWLAGTLPSDGNSRFEIVAQEIAGLDVRITWRSVPGKRYRVHARADLTAEAWSNVTSTPVVATGTTASFNHVGGRNVGARFYRVEVLP